jgi:hypothetical protein
MRSTTSRFAFVATLVMGAAPVGAFDLTGSWQGSWKCTTFDTGTKGKGGNTESTLAVTSLGNNTFRARIDGGIAYRGIEIPDAAKPEKGELAIVHCAGDDDLTTQPFAELGRLKVTTKGAKGTLSGITVWSNDAHHIATCKYKYKRIDTTNPGLTYACP